MSKGSTRIRDLELAVGALSMLVERLVVGDKKWKGEERDRMLQAAATARLLVDCGHMEFVDVEKQIAEDREASDDAAVRRRLFENDGVIARAAGVKEKVEPMRHGDGKRFFIDLPSGDAYSTDDSAEALGMYHTGAAVNIYDRSLGASVVYQGHAVDYPNNIFYGTSL